ncbi:MAG: hypothetical protein RMJ98_10845 [Myxococcales bacterium]|nr:hypothetical protein [Polyangiaceae bacterium]MDW8249783.1 hypothetical protein [Myxococcales bacterium]
MHEDSLAKRARKITQVAYDGSLMNHPGPPPPPKHPSPFTTPRPVDEENINELAELAMVLREEQIQARIVHYKAEMETSPELDAITAQVVEQLKALQRELAMQQKPAENRGNIEQEQIQTLTRLLGRIFRPDTVSVLVEQRLKNVAKKMTKLFFESELHEQTTANQAKLRTIYHAEQALFYVLQRYNHRLRAELEAFEYADPEIKELTIDLLDKTQNDFRVSFLSRRSPELKRMLAILNEVLLNFFRKELPPHLPRLAEEVIQESRSARVETAMGYKVLHESFDAFRQAFERRFLSRLVSHVQHTMVKQLQQSEDSFRDETIAFVQMPQVYSEICALICDGVYDFLCNEGFLDLPIDWRAEIQTQPDIR